MKMIPHCRPQPPSSFIPSSLPFGPNQDFSKAFPLITRVVVGRWFPEDQLIIKPKNFPHTHTHTCFVQGGINKQIRWYILWFFRARTLLVPGRTYVRFLWILQDAPTCPAGRTAFHQQSPCAGPRGWKNSFPFSQPSKSPAFIDKANLDLINQTGQVRLHIIFHRFEACHDFSHVRTRFFFEIFIGERNSLLGRVPASSCNKTPSFLSLGLD